MQVTINYSGAAERWTYPLHTHDAYEINYYIEGEGVLKTASGELPFSPGSIALIPPGFPHGSSSKAGFRLFAARADFGNLFDFSKPLMIQDNAEREAESLVRMIFRNRTKPGDYLSMLTETYAHFILQNIDPEDELTQMVRKVANELADEFHRHELSPAALLRASGYSEDYLRAHFKKVLGKTPVDYLTELRIEHAKYLIHIYRDTRPLLKIADRCGFESYTYFSQRFKALTGRSPREYKKNPTED